jgi:putative peptidoglycan lipid II flippase
MAIWNLAAGHYAQTGTSEGTAPSASTRIVSQWVVSVLLISVTGLAFALVDRYLASFLSEGSIAVLKYADVIASQPRSIIAVALGVAIFPYLAERLKSGDRQRAITIVNRAVRWSLLACVPAVVAMALLSEEIVTVLFERGRFNASSRSATAGVLVIYAFWVLPSVFSTIMDKVFYASMRWRPIMAGLLVSLVSKILLSLWWVPLFGVRALAASSAVSGAAFVCVMLVALPGWIWRHLWRDWLRLSAAAGALTAAACLLGRSVHALVPAFAWWPSALISVLVAAVTTAILLLVLGPHLGISEIQEIRRGARQFLLRLR